MIQPHGGRLVDRVLAAEEKQKVLKHEADFKSLTLDLELISEVENLATGVYSPLEGFLDEKDLNSVLVNRRLSNGTPWTIPIVLDVSAEKAKSIISGERLLLKSEAGQAVAILHVQEKFCFEKDKTAEFVFGTADPAHPGVERLLAMQDVLLSGKIDLIEPVPTPFDRYKLTPKETRFLFREKGWRTAVAFQTRNTPHLGHEYVQKAALTFTDGLFINPVIGKKKKGDFKDEVILASYEELISHYYRKERTVMAILQMEMRYAGPREAIHHAIIRKNFGCTHIIIGRDHAGVGNYYSPFAAQDIFTDFPDLEIVPLFFRSFFYCRKCASVVNEKVCPHPVSEQIQFSGTKIRDMLVRGECPPSELMRPEVAAAVMRFENPFND